ncbi:hypothetical protein B7494_g3062 [Chlorociboria aeruginascens]|nr:hypothetical protein B7494_g3062 [Chlorociboria aeruginascens]
MSNILPLLKGTITLEDALNEDDNILARIEYPRRKYEFYNYLSAHKAEIEATVSFHLGVNECRVSDAKTWMSGSYNVCIPVYINPGSDMRVLFRVPLPYKLGEAKFPGNVDEKLRCEVASYIWIQEHCPDLPIPVLFGFGFQDGQTFTAPETVPFLTRSKWYIKRMLLSWLRFSAPCRYVCRRYPDTLKTGYIIISYITNGSMLSSSWKTLCHDKTRRSNLFRGLARITLSLNKSPLPRIGSLTLNHQGVITLANRPLTLQLQTLENENIPSAISRSSTYSTVDLYLLDLLMCHNNRIHHQPNSIHDQNDGHQQLAALTIMHAILPHFIRRNYRHGPFVFTFTDLHQSNIFVDDKWHITGLIDLEWACSLPIELQGPPYWLSGRAADDIEHGEPLETFGRIVTEYLEAFEQEEKIMVGGALYQTPIMKKCWESGSFWYFEALNSPKGLFRIFNEHVQRLFCLEHCSMRTFDRIVAPYWSFGAVKVIERKIEQEEMYKNQLREAFETKH